MVKRKGLLGLALALVLVPSFAFAQVQSGSILVKAVDDQGNAVPRATVTVTSPVLPAALTGVTDSGGVYRFPGLSVGTYTVKVALKGFQTVTHEGVQVEQSQTITLDFALKVSSVAEEVTVRGEPPVLDTKNTTVNVNLDKNLLNTTPGGKDIWNILEYKVPGLVFDSPDVGGNQAGLQRSFTARGVSNSQNTQLLNGVSVGDPAAIGFSMNYYDPSSFENIQVSTGAQDIALGTSGVVVNMVTKSGTNHFNGQGLFTCQGNCHVGKSTQWHNVDATLLADGFQPNANGVDYVTNSNGQGGGPLVRNKLFYFGSLNFQATHVNVPFFPTVPPVNVPTLLGNTSNEDTTDITTGTGRLTYQLNGSNRFDAYGSKQRYDKPNRGSGGGNTQDSDFKEYDIDNTAQIGWNNVLSDRAFIDTRLSYNNVHFPLTQKTTLEPLADNTTGNQLRNISGAQIMFRRRLQLDSNFQYFLPNLLGGRHELKVGLDNAFTPEDVTLQRVDNLSLAGATPANNPIGPVSPVSVTILNTPVFIKRAVMNTALYAQDSYSVKRLTLIGGIRWERVEGYLPPQTHPSSQYFPTGLVINGLNVNLNTGGHLTSYTVPDTFAQVRNSPLWKNWAPRFSTTYDLTGRGKTILKFSLGKYLDQIGTGTPGPNPNNTVSQRYAWNDSNGDLVFQPGNAVWDGTKYVGGEFGALQSTSIPNPNPFNPTLVRTYHTEVTVGVDQELIPGVRLSASFIHTRDRNPTTSEDIPQSLWSTSYTPVTVIDPGPDGLTGTADDQTFTVFSLNPGVTVNNQSLNDDRVSTHYNGLEVTLEKRYSNGWTVLAGYDYAHTTQALTSLQNPNALINASGEAGGRRHQFKLSGSYLLPWDIQFGISSRLQSGLPYTRIFRVTACSAKVTTNCAFQTGNSFNVNAVPRGSLTLPLLASADIRLGKIFRFGEQRMEFDVDVYNITNANTVFNVGTSSTLTTVQYAGNPTAPVTIVPNFNLPFGVLGPRILRFGLTYNFGR